MSRKESTSVKMRRKLIWNFICLNCYCCCYFFTLLLSLAKINNTLSTMLAGDFRKQHTGNNRTGGDSLQVRRRVQAGARKEVENRNGKSVFGAVAPIYCYFRLLFLFANLCPICVFTKVTTFGAHANKTTPHYSVLQIDKKNAFVCNF